MKPKMTKYKQNPHWTDMKTTNQEVVGTRISKKSRQEIIRFLTNRQVQICSKRKNNWSSKNK